MSGSANIPSPFPNGKPETVKLQKPKSGNPIRLTSPPTKGPAVKALQKALAGDNIYRKNFRPGKVDGVYGEGTAAAVARAKHYLGFAPNQLSGAAVGPWVEKYLSGDAKLPPLFKARQKARIRALQQAAAKGKLRDRALKLALTQIGVEEKPANSNRVKYSTWYGMIGPWCAMFTTWCYVQSGSKAMKKGSKWAYVPYVLSATYDPKSGVTRTADPQPGDMVLFDWDNDGVADHIGLFIKWTSKRAGQFEAVEGNTAVGDNSNGGKVMKRDRRKSDVIAFVTVHR